MEDKEEDIIHLNPIEDKLLGAYKGYVYFKAENQDYIVVTPEKEYLKLIKLFIKAKRDYCEKYNHFCGVFGEFSAKKYRKAKQDIHLIKYLENMESEEVPYPTYIVDKFDKHCNMEHG